MSDGRYRGGPGDDAEASRAEFTRPPQTRRMGPLGTSQSNQERPRSRFNEAGTGSFRDPRSEDYVAPPRADAERTGRAVGCPPELAARLEEAATLHAQLGRLDHYALLGVASDAPPVEIRRSYFALSKRFHPDTFFRRDLGARRAQLEAVFDALTRAYETLRRPGTRTEYDDERAIPESRRHRELPSERPRRDSVSTRPESESDRVLREVSQRTSSAPPAPVSAPSGRPVRPAGQARPVVSESDAAPFSRPPATGSVTKPSDTTGLASSPPAPKAPRPSMQSNFPSAPPTGTRPSAGAPPAGTPPFGGAGTGTSPTLSDRPGGPRPAQPSAPAPQASQPPGGGGTGFEGPSTLLRELDQLVRQRLSQPPGARQSVPPPEGPSTGTRPLPGAPPSLEELADQLRGLGGLRHWASQRLREAHHEELAGHVVDAANILRIVLQQLKDPHIEAHVQRLGRLSAQKTAPAHRLRARAAEQEREFQEAADLWQRVRDASPNDADAAYHHARMLLAVGDLKAAGRAAMRAVELSPDHVEARELLIAFFDRMGMKLNARRERDTVQRLLEARAAHKGKGK